MKVLSIGNSFSQDAHRWLHTMAEYDGITLETVNLYIGGCSLQMHWDNLRDDLAAYDLERNGGAAEGKISIAAALEMDDWDVVTLQQASPDCGFYESYQPYLRELTAFVREKCPNAVLYFHQTWAYEHGATHPAFARYQHDQKEMYRRLTACAQRAAVEMGANLIPAGLVIQTLRETVPAFDTPNGGMTLCRDGYHLTLDYGRYAAAATWYRVLLGGTAKPAAFPAFQETLLKQINATIGQLL